MLLLLAVLASQSEVTAIRPDAEGTPLLLADPKPRETDWPGYRGPYHQGRVELTTPWTATAAVPDVVPVWKALADTTAGAPCLWGSQVFVVIVDPADYGVRLVSLDQSSGTTQWEVLLPTDALTETTANELREHWNQRCFTPACDGTHVFVPTIAAGDVRLNAVSLTGELSWSAEVGPYWGDDGYGISPVVHGPLVILAVDQSSPPLFRWQRRSYIAGLHRQTGQSVWRTLRPDGAAGGVPVIAEVAGRTQLLQAGKGAVRSYDPNTGTEIWSCRWSAGQAEGGVVTDDQHVYVAAAHPGGELMCVRADGEGDVTGSHLVWRNRPTLATSGFLVLADPLLIQQRRDGSIQACDKTTGTTVWKTRLPQSLLTPPILAGRQLLCLDEQGLLHVFDVDRRGESVLEKSIPGLSSRCLVLSGSSLLLTTSDGISRLDTATRVVVQPPSSRQTQ